jgi:histidine triad (HIT) family protein
MDNCIFCKIVNGEIPSDKLYEDDKFLAFLTIEPVSDGHLLVIPKEHIVWMHDAPDDIIAGIFQLGKKLMPTLKKLNNADYIQVTVSGEEIPHFHVHLFQRFYNDGLLRFPHKKYKEGEASEIAKKIISSL